MFHRLLISATVMAMCLGVPFADSQTSGVVEGEVMMVTQGIPGTMVIRDHKGQAVILHLTQQTQMGAQFKPGDKVEAYVTPYGVTSVKPKTTK